jgi:hypothetical protein
MAKSTKKAAKKAAPPAAKKAKPAKTKVVGPRVRTGVADQIRSHLKQAGGPVKLSQLNAALKKDHSAASIYSALQYMGRRKEISRRGRAASATYTIGAATHATPAATPSAAKPAATRKRRGRKGRPAAAASAPATSNFSSMIAELRRVAMNAEKAILQKAIKSTDYAIRSLAEMAADLRERATSFLKG